LNFGLSSLVHLTERRIGRRRAGLLATPKVVPT